MQPSDNWAAAGNNFPLEIFLSAAGLAGSISGTVHVNLECRVALDVNIRICNSYNEPVSSKLNLYTEAIRKRDTAGVGLFSASLQHDLAHSLIHSLPWHVADAQSDRMRSSVSLLLCVRPKCMCTNRSVLVLTSRKFQQSDKVNLDFWVVFQHKISDTLILITVKK